VPIPRRPLKADELIGLNAGGDVHLGVTVQDSWGQNACTLAQ
jgi:hypothetical protein